MPTTNYHWSSVLDCVMHETEENGDTTVEYTHEPALYGPLLSEQHDGIEYVHHYDGLGTTVVLTADTGTVTDTFAYDAWGKAVDRIGTTATSYTWLAQYGYSISSSLDHYYVRQRVYSPITCRWASIDPLLVLNRFSSYSYSANMPLTAFDPSGLEWIAVDATKEVWKATKDGDSLRELAVLVSGREQDWVCIWPKPDPVLWEDYPKAKCDAQAEVQNLLASEAKSQHKLSIGVQTDGIDNYLVAVQLLTRPTLKWRRGIAAANFIKKESGQGRHPITLLLLAGHGSTNVPNVLAHPLGKYRFSADDVVGVADEKDNSTNTYGSASKRTGPPRCWFSSDARVFGIGCYTGQFWVDDWAQKLLRQGASAFGAQDELFGEHDGRGASRVWFKDFQGEAATTLEQLLASPHWVLAPGTL